MSDPDYAFQMLEKNVARLSDQVSKLTSDLQSWKYNVTQDLAERSRQDDDMNESLEKLKKLVDDNAKTAKKVEDWGKNLSIGVRFIIWLGGILAFVGSQKDVLVRWFHAIKAGIGW